MDLPDSLRCLIIREVFIGLLRMLDWQTLSNLYEAVPRRLRGTLFPDTTWYADKIAGFVVPINTLSLRPGPISFRDYMSLLHLSIHGLHLKNPMDHNVMKGNYGFLVDAFNPIELKPPQPSKSEYLAICFLPPGAPHPFSSSFWTSDTNCLVKIFISTPRGLEYLSSFITPGNIQSFAASPGGTTVLLLGLQYNVTIVRLSEGQIDVGCVELGISYFGGLFRDSIFGEGEDTFVLPDKTWCFYKFTHDRIRRKVTRVSLVSPTFLYPVTVSISGKRAFREFPNTNRTAMMTYLYLPTSPLHPDCLVLAEHCPLVRGATVPQRHSTMKHVLQMLVSPSSSSDPYYLVFCNGEITDYVSSYERDSVFVVVLTWVEEFLFRKFPPSATRSKPAECLMSFESHSMSNICVYEISLSDFVGLPEAVKVTPRFYIPSEKKMLETKGPHYDELHPRFSKTFNLRSDHWYRASCNRRFLIVAHSPHCLLLFSLTAARNTPPFFLNFTDFVDVKTVCSTAEMLYVAAIPNPNQTIKLKVCSICPERAKLYQVETETHERLVVFPERPTFFKTKSRFL